MRTDGDWEGWTDFFLDGVATIADEAVTSARELFALVTVEALEKAGVLVETTGKKRDRSWVYQRYVDKLRVGRELESPGRP